MTLALPSGAAPRRPNYRLRRFWVEAGSVVVGLLLLIWWGVPLYNLLFIALDPDGRPEFSGNIWPDAPTLESFDAVLFRGYWYLHDFWRQFGNSFFVGVMTISS